jgi:L-ascorbate metabolism protein UlaG (beta-lactamase superfamily)
MTRTLTGTLLGIALAAAAVPALADDTIATDKGDLVIHPFHHASMLITWNGLNILVDPAPPFGGTKPADITAEYKAVATPDVILVTHAHGDHFNVPILQAVAGADTVLVTCRDVADKLPADLKAKTKVLANDDSLTVDNVPVTAVAAYNTTTDRAKFHPEARHDNGYVLTLGGKRVYIAGDTEETPEMKALTNIDVAFLPMNLPYTMDIEQAAQAVKDFRPKIVYPYHYAGSDLNAFKTLVGDAAEVRLRDWYPKPGA